MSATCFNGCQPTAIGESEMPRKKKREKERDISAAQGYLI